MPRLRGGLNADRLVACECQLGGIGNFEMKIKKVPVRRMGVENSQTRAQLVEEAMKLALKEGVSAVTARRLAEKLGLKRQIIHYYFSTIEDLLIAVIKRNSEDFRERRIKALDSDDPLSVIWNSGSDVPAIIFEFTAMSLRNKSIRAEFGRYMVEMRRIESVAIGRYLEHRGITPRVSPATLATLLSALSHVLSMERRLGTVEGHNELRAIVDGWLKACLERGSLLIEPQK
jgi:AcrR family transcriptional regulator